MANELDVMALPQEPVLVPGSPKDLRKRKYETMEAEMLNLQSDTSAPSNDNNTTKQPECTPPAKRKKLNNGNITTLRRLSQNQDLSDVQFQVGNVQFFGLKAIFAVQSDVFRDMLYPQNGDFIRFMKIQNTSADAFEFIRDSFYDLKPELTLNNVVSVLSASKTFDLSGIQTKCQSFLNTITDVNGLLTLLTAFAKQPSLEYEMKQLLQSNVALLQKDAQQIIESEIFQSLPFAVARNVIESDDLGIKEEVLWNNTKHWLATNGDELKQCIRFCQMDTEFVFAQVKTSGILSEKELVLLYEKKLGLNAECMFNCNARFVVKKKQRRGKRARKVEYELSAEMTECLNVLKELMKQDDVEPFLEPVDWKAWGLTDYPEIVEIPMDLGTVQSNTKNGKYEDKNEFAADVRLVWDNAKSYNIPESDIYNAAQTLSDFFEANFSTIA
eukprot:797080_1